MRVPIALQVVVEHHRSVAVEPDGRPVRTTYLLGSAHDDRLTDIALAYPPPRNCLLHGNNDDVADAGKSAAGAAKDLDALHTART